MEVRQGQVAKAPGQARVHCRSPVERRSDDRSRSRRPAQHQQTTPPLSLVFALMVKNKKKQNKTKQKQKQISPSDPTSVVHSSPQHNTPHTTPQHTPHTSTLVL
eukprot:TRINITY_DN3901_c1_g1_i1.p3 TRINITY_DN3901_c1_g1~~TRINITY_DN3901_c1_g1_i1.p3  ORF type:complete len:104 (+),score=30.64 TRINITY_DN3901_c1_g1_i1:1166-1477(+)